MLNLETFKQDWDTRFPDVRLRRSHFILAVSGGVDSIVLTHLMHTVKANCTIAHVNFQLRGAESQRDEQFVRDFAEQLNMPIKVHLVDTAKYAATYKLGIQQAAREIRYAWFGALMQEIESNKPVVLLTAHHANDNVETVLMQLFRGTGIHGLTGIPYRRKDVLNMARPLIHFSKEDILAYAAANGLTYVEDSSNEKDNYTRNFIRNKLLPQIASIYPNVNENILATSQRIAEAEQIVIQAVDSFWKKGIKLKKGIPTIPVTYWNKVRDNDTYTWGLVKKYGFKPQQLVEIHKLLTANKGAYIASSSHKLIQWDHQIQIVSLVAEKEYLSIDQTAIGNTITTKHGQLHFELIKNTPDLVMDKDPRFAYLDASKMEWPLLLRSWEPSDYFYPLGMPKKKKLNQFLGNLKLSPAIKSKVNVLCSGDRIAWVVGTRIDDRFKIKSSTQKVLKITFLSNV